MEAGGAPASPNWARPTVATSMPSIADGLLSGKTRLQNETWGLGYIDLYLIHFPCALKYIDPDVRQYPGTESRTWEGMEAVGDAGLVRDHNDNSLL
ncbi:hypothetical protein NEMBOFW57_010161 [Staphylotrichum longicolle]|uniref:NADP-dependent oxidoreductase domain-containing protein n=1 Tax=Staphylotrichum longicolle TaxID=669026 RepID=A0AAD4EU12_9PEZI|nr:hypothetical protein NEMBOFW57_010161 [Staphylotrichum longicolle]